MRGGDTEERACSLDESNVNLILEGWERERRTMQIGERGVGPRVDGQSAIRAAVGKEGLTNNCGHFGEMIFKMFLPNSQLTNLPQTRWSLPPCSCVHTHEVHAPVRLKVATLLSSIADREPINF